MRGSLSLRKCVEFNELIDSPDRVRGTLERPKIGRVPRWAVVAIRRLWEDCLRCEEIARLFDLPVEMVRGVVGVQS